MSKIQLESISPRAQGGHRRLPQNIYGRPVYYATEDNARREWPKLLRRRFDYAEDRAASVIKVDFKYEDDKGWVICGILHPACEHWFRTLWDFGVKTTMGTGRENWEVQPPRTLEELAMMPKGHGGRYLP